MTDRQALFAALKQAAAAKPAIAPLFEQDSGRFASFSRRAAGLTLDFSKTALTTRSLGQLLALARACDVEGRRDAMFGGETINNTESRSVLHVALRNAPDRPIAVDGRDVMPEVTKELGRVCAFAESVRSGAVKGSGGAGITDVVNIGIGGSDLGPVMATLALAPYHDGPRTHFVSNVDPAHLADTLKSLDPATTLFIVASKTFTTAETMANAQAARAWVAKALGEAAVKDHFCAVSTALKHVEAFGIGADRMFGFWDWVGGRYSLWSSIGLSIVMAVGEANFRAFLGGARAMDEHFRTAPLADNLPVLMGLVGVWHRNGCGYPARAVLPYEQRLVRLPAYLQQLEMESNGKSVTRDGAPVRWPTGPLVWGEPGTNGQHAFYQLLHQGTDVIPAEFLVGAEGHEPDHADMHAMLVANCLAQSEALMRGRTRDQARDQLLAMGRSEADADRVAPHRVFPGDRPSVTILYRKLDPATLGAIIALYEHRVFVEAAIYDINAYDQWGVELGKELATAFLPLVTGEKADAPASTKGLAEALRALQG
ncbi:glucose-6-phosphate isomerase [Alsobacter soli]|uniref:Glucose-6-phosphate isomerase n=1 Tax=Alsobacter soli TaxID=2109933 RepID=A0A2T1HX45_9HYPH|nr:glucose-6-phosphate isomerase [Alsobacter soli]PSC06184.1 glucose-6-phosphate isomerase [Alsobacter soli]